MAQQTKDVVCFLKKKLKARLAILWSFFKKKTSLTIKTTPKNCNYIKKKTIKIKPDAIDTSKIVFYRKLLSVIFASGLLCVLFLLLFNSNTWFDIFVFNGYFFFVYFVFLQIYWIYKIFKCLNQMYKTWVDSKTKFNFEFLKNKLKTTKKIFFFFFIKQVLAVSFRFLFFFETHNVLVRFVMKICVYFAMWLYTIAIPAYVISFFFFEFNFYSLFQRDYKTASFFDIYCLNYLIICNYFFYKWLHKIFKTLPNIWYDIIFVLYYIKKNFNLNWLRKTIRKELKPIKAKIREDLYFYFIDLIGDLKKIFFFFSKKWLLDHYLEFEYFVRGMLFVLVLLSFFWPFF